MTKADSKGDGLPKTLVVDNGVESRSAGFRTRNRNNTVICQRPGLVTAKEIERALRRVQRRLRNKAGHEAQPAREGV